jgi:hypothetical protein
MADPTPLASVSRRNRVLVDPEEVLRAQFSLSATSQAAGLLLPVTAAPPLHQSVEVDETFYGEGLTELCGVPVYIHLEASRASPTSTTRAARTDRA